MTGPVRIRIGPSAGASVICSATSGACLSRFAWSARTGTTRKKPWRWWMRFPRCTANAGDRGSGRTVWWQWVERTLSWLNQFRRLRVRYDKRADIQEAFLSLGCALIFAGSRPARLERTPTFSGARRQIAISWANRVRAARSGRRSGARPWESLYSSPFAGPIAFRRPLTRIIHRTSGFHSRHAPRRLRSRRADRRRRDGRSVSRPRHETESRRGDQGPARPVANDADRLARFPARSARCSRR